MELLPAHFWTDRWLDVPIVDMLDNLPQYLDLTTKIQEFLNQVCGIRQSLRSMCPLTFLQKFLGTLCLLETYILGDLYFKVS